MSSGFQKALIIDAVETVFNIVVRNYIFTRKTLIVRKHPLEYQ